MHLLCELTEGGGRKLMTVTRVMGKHKVQAIVHDGWALAEVEITTHGIDKPDSPVKLVNYVDGKFPEIGALEVYTPEPR